MTLLDEEKSHITLVDAGEVFVGGRYHSLVPIMQERLTGMVAITYFKKFCIVISVFDR